ncbi:uncharacterized protein BROUX77_006653 [Berkeleyomyces rouxiae]|uniref:uncharacterized protein n=1 Tax=Berkeleyomyces rouxiae TaxID=2035830 RepID=UPI003B79D306
MDCDAVIFSQRFIDRKKVPKQPELIRSRSETTYAMTTGDPDVPIRSIEVDSAADVQLIKVDESTPETPGGIFDFEFDDGNSTPQMAENIGPQSSSEF